MRRERFEILKKMDMLQMQKEAEYELGCGFGSKEISEAFAPEEHLLDEMMASTYGLSVEQYYDREMEIGMKVQEKLFGEGILPFN